MKQHILILGAGRSSGSLINYLGKWTKKSPISLTVADLDLDLVRKKTIDYPHIQVVKINISDAVHLENLIIDATIVVSMLPHLFHLKVAKLCLKHSKHMLTASYAKHEIKVLNKKAKEKNLVFLFELGADPGIDHLSACRIIENIKNKDGKIHSFKSFTGALMSLKDELDNPWKYKFTWNPKNVVIAGQGEMARYRENKLTYYVPYPRLFSKLWSFDLPNVGSYEAYANRNSLDYSKHYKIDGVPTIIRGTLRRPGFCEAWYALALLGVTENITKINIPTDYTYKDFFLKLTDSADTFSNKHIFEQLIRTSLSKEAWEKIQYLELDSEKIIPYGTYTAAEILEKILLEKWKLNEQDKDMLLMYHEVEYTIDHKHYQHTSLMSLEGKDVNHTAISDTVGLPLAMGVKLLATGKIKETGVILPFHSEIYIPILNELNEFGITFIENETEIK